MTSRSGVVVSGLGCVGAVAGLTRPRVIELLSLKDVQVVNELTKDVAYLLLGAVSLAVVGTGAFITRQRRTDADKTQTKFRVG